MALIVVLWAVALISGAMLGLAAILQRQLGQEVAALQNSRATLVAESGLQMVLSSQIQPAMTTEASRVLSGELRSGWGVPVRFKVGAEDLRGEDGKINLNALAMGDRAERGGRVYQSAVSNCSSTPLSRFSQSAGDAGRAACRCLTGKRPIPPPPPTT